MVINRKEHTMTLSEESGIGYRNMHLIPTFFAQILHSTPYFFILVFPTAFYDRSRMTGRYLIRFCKNIFSRIKKDLPKEVSLIGISDSQIRTCSSQILSKRLLNQQSLLHLHQTHIHHGDTGSYRELHLPKRSSM